MYDSVRHLFGVIVLAVLVIAIILFITKREKRKIIILTGILVVLIYLTVLIFPVESCFLRFDSSERAFYYSFGPQQIVGSFEDKHCGYIIYDTGRGFVETVLSRDQNGWKIPYPGYYIQSARILTNLEHVVLVKRHVVDNMYLFRVSDGMKNEVKTITDTQNNKFHKIEVKGGSIYLVFVRLSDANYRVIINDIQYSID